MRMSKKEKKNNHYNQANSKRGVGEKNKREAVKSLK